MSDWDTQRLRYNQFVRMLKSRGGWEVEPMERLNYIYSLPFRITQQALDKGLTTVTDTSNVIKAAYEDATTLSPNGDSTESLSKQALKSLDKSIHDSIDVAKYAYDGLLQYILPYVQPVITSAEDLVESVRYEPKIASAIQALSEFNELISKSINNLHMINDDDINQIIDRY